jgi:uncharacterized membrane protein
MPDLPSVGSLCLGIFVGFLVWYFVKRFANYTAEGLTAVVAVLVGGVITAFLDAPIPGVPSAAAGSAGPAASPEHRWWYPIGLLAGFLLWYVAEWIRTKAAPSFSRGPDS